VNELFTQNKYDIRVCAPEKEESGVSHAVSVRKPLYAEDFVLPHNLGSIKAFSVSGTPADCVRLSLLSTIFEGFQPDVVLSGINRGNNSGLNVIYSGTVGGAREGAIFGVPSVALSLNHPVTYPSRDDIWPFDIAAAESIPIIDGLLERAREETFLQKTVLNVNFPSVHNKDEIKGIKITQQGCSRFKEEFHEDTKSQGARRCFKLSGQMPVTDTSDAFDTFALHQGWITITPLGLRTDLRLPEEVQKFENWFQR